jgi:broad specificity phosphatase PhoE
MEGNLRARRRVERAKVLLSEIGLEPERLEMFNLSSAQGPRFAEIVTEMTTRLTELGPSPFRPARGAEEGIHEMTKQAEANLTDEAHGCVAA